MLIELQAQRCLLLEAILNNANWLLFDITVLVFEIVHIYEIIRTYKLERMIIDVVFNLLLPSAVFINTLTWYPVYLNRCRVDVQSGTAQL